MSIPTAEMGDYRRNWEKEVGSRRIPPSLAVDSERQTMAFGQILRFIAEGFPFRAAE
jgi:hypothetical protein